MSSSKWEGKLCALCPHTNLRKRARTLEQEIDKALVAYNRLHQSITTANTTGARAQSSSWSSADRQPLIGAGGDDVHAQFDALSAQLHASIAQLQEINDEMHALTAAAQSMDAATYSNAAVQHTLRRHEDILRDYANELTRTRANIQRALDRRTLLGASSDDDGGGGMASRRNDGLIKEHGHIRNSDRMLDEQISIAMTTKEHLLSQRSNLKDIWKRVDSITKRYPAVNSLMHKIQLKRRKDAIVVGAVVTVCLILIFLYMTM